MKTGIAKTMPMRFAVDLSRMPLRLKSDRGTFDVGEERGIPNYRHSLRQP